MNPKCFDVLNDIVMLERTAVFDLKILTEVICLFYISVALTHVEFQRDKFA